MWNTGDVGRAATTWPVTGARTSSLLCQSANGRQLRTSDAHTNEPTNIQTEGHRHPYKVAAFAMGALL